ncbi:Cytoplasmic Dynein 2 Intermediate Chain 1 [Manis pentadactyla]|nr:Cytoplasmic Dynein 2 Intermediate Chain 1 [Manis pentadactyla]
MPCTEVLQGSKRMEPEPTHFDGGRQVREAQEMDPLGSILLVKNTMHGALGVWPGPGETQSHSKDSPPFQFD